MKSTSSRPTVSLIDVSAYLPEKRVPAEYYANFAGTDDLRRELMFRAPQFRHLARKDESNVDMVQRAVAGLVERHGADVVSKVDILLTHSQLLVSTTSFRAAAARSLVDSAWSPRGFSTCTTADAAFVHLMRLARSMLTSGSGQTALIALAQSGAGKIFNQEEVRKKALLLCRRWLRRGAAPGVGQIADPGHLVPVLQRVRGRHDADNHRSETYLVAGRHRRAPCRLRRVQHHRRDCSRQPPCSRAGAGRVRPDWREVPGPGPAGHQPAQPGVLRKWRKALGLPRERHHDTFDECGNLFGVGIPVNFDSAINAGKVKAGDTVMMAGFAHAGDFAGAAAIRWGGRG